MAGRVIWVAAVVSDVRWPPTVSIHPSYDDAVAFVRAGWDPEDVWAALDGDALVERLLVECDTSVTIEPCEAAWL